MLPITSKPSHYGCIDLQIVPWGNNGNGDKKIVATLRRDIPESLNGAILFRHPSRGDIVILNTDYAKIPRFPHRPIIAAFRQTLMNDTLLAKALKAVGIKNADDLLKTPFLAAPPNPKAPKPNKP